MNPVERLIDLRKNLLDRATPMGEWQIRVSKGFHDGLRQWLLDKWAKERELFPESLRPLRKTELSPPPPKSLKGQRFLGFEIAKVEGNDPVIFLGEERAMEIYRDWAAFDRLAGGGTP